MKQTLGIGWGMVALKAVMTISTLGTSGALAQSHSAPAGHLGEVVMLHGTLDQGTIRNVLSTNPAAQPDAMRVISIARPFWLKLIEGEVWAQAIKHDVVVDFNC